jgi:Na+/melibiose symporter-like transporter
VDQERHVLHADPLGMILAPLAVLSLLLGLHSLGRTGLAGTLSSLAAAAFFIGALAFVSSKVENPVLDLQLLRKGRIVPGIVGLACITLTHNAAAFLLPFYLQDVAGHSSKVTGHTLFAYSLTVVVFAPIAGLLSEKLGTRVVAVMGALTACVSVLTLSWIGLGSTPLVIAMILIVLGVGSSLYIPANALALLSSVPTKRLGSTNGLMLASQNVANTLGVTLSTLTLGLLLSHYGVSEERSQWPTFGTEVSLAFQHTLTALALFPLIATLAVLRRSSTSPGTSGQ